MAAYFVCRECCVLGKKLSGLKFRLYALKIRLFSRLLTQLKCTMHAFNYRLINVYTAQLTLISAPCLPSSFKSQTGNVSTKTDLANLLTTTRTTRNILFRPPNILTKLFIPSFQSGLRKRTLSLARSRGLKRFTLMYLGPLRSFTTLFRDFNTLNEPCRFSINSVVPGLIQPK